MDSSGDDGSDKKNWRASQSASGSWQTRPMGRVRPRRGRPTGSRPFQQSIPTLALTKEEEMRRVQREQRFADSEASPTTSAKGWSAAVWKEDAASLEAARKEKDTKPARSAIGLGRATGLSRVPDAVLSRSREGMETRLANLILRFAQLEDDGCALVSLETGSKRSASTTGVLEAWESILADFRQLTMAVTASPLEDVNSLSLRIYEAAADACLLGGNMSFYHACQTRLLSDIYAEYPAGASSARRRDEFIGYSLLCFGVFSVDNRELAAIMRRMSPKTLASPFVRFAMAVLVAYRNRNATKFLAMFNACGTRQKTILASSLDLMRSVALRTIVRSYLTLDKAFSLSRVGLHTESEFLELLQTERPDLHTHNLRDSTAYHFRLK